VYDGLRLLHLFPSSFSVEVAGLLTARELQNRASVKQNLESR
jgi:hypothetical protein